MKARVESKITHCWGMVWGEVGVIQSLWKNRFQFRIHLTCIQHMTQQPWPNAFIDRSIILYTKGLQVQFLVRAHAWVAVSIPCRHV